jgi:hypothetical protein
LTDLGFKRLKGFNPNYGTHSFFSWSSRRGFKLGISIPFCPANAEAKRRIRAKFGNLDRVSSGDGKMTWELYFTHHDTPGIYYTIYDWKGSLSCGFGVANDIYKVMEKSYADTLNRYLTALMAFALEA